jgi:hypothetical protein
MVEKTIATWALLTGVATAGPNAELRANGRLWAALDDS